MAIRKPHKGIEHLYSIDTIVTYPPRFPQPVNNYRCSTSRCRGVGLLYYLRESFAGYAGVDGPRDVDIGCGVTDLGFIARDFLLAQSQVCYHRRKPVLTFVYDDETGWNLRNIGNGPALNVIVAQKDVGGQWFNPVRVSPLTKDRAFVCCWLGNVITIGLGVTYTDFKTLEPSDLPQRNVGRSPHAGVGAFSRGGARHADRLRT